MARQSRLERYAPKDHQLVTKPTASAPVVAADLSTRGDSLTVKQLVELPQAPNRWTVAVGQSA
jgi:hypothetical protein